MDLNEIGLEELEWIHLDQEGSNPLGGELL
jgi:hypothetical protein